MYLICVLVCYVIFYSLGPKPRGETHETFEINMEILYVTLPPYVYMIAYSVHRLSCRSGLRDIDGSFCDESVALLVIWCS